jgi:hypothetical protein
MTTAVAVVMHLIKYQHNALEQTHYREALAISAIFADVLTLLSVRDDGPTSGLYFHATLEDASGRRQIVLQPSENRFPVGLAAGRGSFALTIDEPTSGPVPGNGDTRPLILHLTDYSIKRGGKGQP